MDYPLPPNYKSSYKKSQYCHNIDVVIGVRIVVIPNDHKSY